MATGNMVKSVSGFISRSEVGMKSKTSGIVISRRAPSSSCEPHRRWAAACPLARAPRALFRPRRDGRDRSCRAASRARIASCDRRRLLCAQSAFDTRARARENLAAWCRCGRFARRRRAGCGPLRALGRKFLRRARGHRFFRHALGRIKIGFLRARRASLESRRDQRASR